MKIKTITLHCTDNCGSTLQAMALQKYLISQGHETEIIDYCPAYLQYNGSRLKTTIKRILFFRKSMNQIRKNRAFRRRYLITTKEKYSKYKKLRENPPYADRYMTGSDQIWNPSYLCGKDPAYYLEFVREKEKKYSYAASIGKSDIPDEQKEYIVSKVKDFRSISVREKTSAEFLKERVSCPVDYVCDPVFLLQKEYYESILKKPDTENPYILVYLVQPSAILDNLIAELRKKYGVQVILIYGLKKNCDCDRHIMDVAPDEFLGYIAGAEYVVASSFHAAAFCHIFQKQFAMVLPEANTARITQLLEVSGLQNRIVSQPKQIEVALREIDFSDPQKRLQDFILHSKEVLNGYCS